MAKKPPLIAFLIAVTQLDATDHIYVVHVQTKDEAMNAVSAREPGGAMPRHVGTLGASTVKRIKLKAGEVREI